MTIFYLALLLVPISALFYVFVLRDKFDRRAQNESLHEELEYIQRKAQKFFPTVNLDEFEYSRIVRNLPSDVLEVQNQNHTAMGNLVLSSVNRKATGEDVTIWELKYNEQNYTVEYRWGIFIKNAVGDVLATAKITWPSRHGKMDIAAEVYEYRRFFWGEKAISKNGNLMMFSASSGFSSKTLLLTRPEMNNEFHATSIAVSVAY